MAGFDHFDGVDRAGAHAQAAARALGFDHGKKVLGQPRDAAHGAGGVTQPTADAARRVNAGGGKGQLAAVFGVDVAGGLSRGSGELFNAGASAGGAAVDRGCAERHGAGILGAAVKAALTALRLRQKTAKRLGKALRAQGVVHG